MLGQQFKTSEIIVVTTGTIINFLFFVSECVLLCNSATGSRRQGVGF